MGYFTVMYDSGVIIYERKMFMRLATDYSNYLQRDRSLQEHRKIMLQCMQLDALDKIKLFLSDGVTTSD